jgi:hypothetical protein
MLIFKKISMLDYPLHSIKYPLSAPIPNKGDEISFGEIFGIVDSVAYTVTTGATEIYIKVKGYDEQ